MIKKHLNIRSKEKNSAYIKPKCKKNVKTFSDYYFDKTIQVFSCKKV